MSERANMKWSGVKLHFTHEPGLTNVSENFSLGSKSHGDFLALNQRNVTNSNCWLIFYYTSYGFLQHRICAIPLFLHYLLQKARGAQAHPFIASAEEKQNAMHNPPNSYKAGNPAEASSAISYLVLRHLISVNDRTVDYFLQLYQTYIYKEKPQSPTRSRIKC